MIGQGEDPFVQIWPFGHGVLVTGYGSVGDVPAFVIAAAPDDLTSDAGGDATQAMAYTLNSKGPRAILTFKDAAAVQRLCNELQDFATSLDPVHAANPEAPIA